MFAFPQFLLLVILESNASWNKRHPRCFHPLRPQWTDTLDEEADDDVACVWPVHWVERATTNSFPARRKGDSLDSVQQQKTHIGLGSEHFTRDLLRRDINKTFLLTCSNVGTRHQACMRNFYMVLLESIIIPTPLSEYSKIDYLIFFSFYIIEF